MKSKHLIICLLTGLLITSCATNNYQVYKVEPISKINKSERIMTFEDENCSVMYDFWSEGGNVGFMFLNKTDSNLYVNLEECFFIKNGQAFNYFKNRIFSSSTNVGTNKSNVASASKSMTGINNLNLIQTNRISSFNSVGISTLYGKSTSIVEEKLICIPPRSYKSIYEYKINEILITSCDLDKYPIRNKKKSVKFNNNDSPVRFSNRIVYIMGTKKQKIENEFYISEITNYKESDIIEFRYDIICGKKETVGKRYFKNSDPDKFYIKYM